MDKSQVEKAIDTIRDQLSSAERLSWFEHADEEDRMRAKSLVKQAFLSTLTLLETLDLVDGVNANLVETG